MGDSTARRSESRLHVVVVAEQLRRPVPGGIGTYTVGLLSGLAALSRSEPASSWASDGEPGRSGPARVTVLASPLAKRGPDPLNGLGDELVITGRTWAEPLAKLAMATGSRRLSAVPNAVTSRLWDRGVTPELLKSLSRSAGPAAGVSVVHGTSLSVPPAGRIPLTAMVHDVAWRQAPDTFPRRGLAWHEAALRRLSRLASAIVVPSQAAATALLGAAAELDPALVEVIPHGCDHLELPDVVAAKRRLSELGVQGDYILSVGTLEPRKNLRRLMAAYAKARPELPAPWPLVVVGPPGWGDGLGEAEGVVFTGPMSGAELSGLYAGAVLMAYVPLTEGYGLPPVEAMWSGTPVIASTGVPSVLELGRGCADLVDPESVEAMAAAIGRLAGDEQAREALRAAGKAAVAGRTWAEAARAHVVLWERVAR